MWSASALQCLGAHGGSSCVEGSVSPQALLAYLHGLATLPAMQQKLQVLSDALPMAPLPGQGAGLIDGANWEGEADSEAWQYDLKV